MPNYFQMHFLTGGFLKFHNLYIRKTGNLGRESIKDC